MSIRPSITLHMHKHRWNKHSRVLKFLMLVSHENVADVCSFLSELFLFRGLGPVD